MKIYKLTGCPVQRWFTLYYCDNGDLFYIDEIITTVYKNVSEEEYNNILLDAIERLAVFERHYKSVGFNAKIVVI